MSVLLLIIIYSFSCSSFVEIKFTHIKITHLKCIIQWVLVNSELCIHHPNQYLKTFNTPKKKPYSVSNPSHLPKLPPPHTTLNLLPFFIDSLFWLPFLYFGFLNFSPIDNFSQMLRLPCSYLWSSEKLEYLSVAHVHHSVKSQGHFPQGALGKVCTSMHMCIQVLCTPMSSD